MLLMACLKQVMDEIERPSHRKVRGLGWLIYALVAMWLRSRQPNEGGDWVNRQTNEVTAGAMWLG